MNTKRNSQSAEKAGLDQADITRLSDISKKAAENAGKVLMNHYGRLKEINTKKYEGDLVTNADLEAEELVLNYLSEHSPDIAILSEEFGAKGKTNELKWVVDPLDGTTNFAHGFPFFATSIGLTWNDNPILGTVEVPFFKESYWAAPGIGAFCNEKKIRVSSCKKLSDSLLVTGFAYDRKKRLDNNYAEFCWLTHRTRGVRRAGAAAVDLAFIASGRVDAYWERGLSQWDLAAGAAIVEEAGGAICDYSGNEFALNSGRIIASTPGIKAELISVLNQVKPLKGEMFGAPEINDFES